MEKFFTGILRKRGLVLILAAIALAASVISLLGIQLNSDVARYLPDNSISKQTVTLLRENFNINGDAEICIEASVEDYDLLVGLAEELSALDSVSELQWLGSYEDMFKFEGDSIVSSNQLLPDENVSKLTNTLFFEYDGSHYYTFLISLTAANATGEAGEALEEIEGILKDFPLPYSLGGTAVQGNDMLKSALGELPMFVAVAFVVILIILLVTSPSVISAIIFLVTIGISIIYNMGTNFFTEDISTVTFSVAAILQLALSMDYSIFLTHAFEKNRAHMDNETAMVAAIKQTLAVITASALTTVAGFCALFAMRFTMGFDMGLCLAKGVIFSFLAVIFVQPCLILSLSRVMDKTSHKYLNPSFEGLSRLPRKLRLLAPVLVLVLLIPAFLLGTGVEYYYLDSHYDPDASGPQAAIQSTGSQVVLVTETVSAEKQLELAEKIKNLQGVNSVTGYYSLIQDMTSGISIPVYSSLTRQDESTLMFVLEPETAELLALMEGDSAPLEKQVEAGIKVYVARQATASSSQSQLEHMALQLAETVKAQLTGLQESFGEFSSQLDQYRDKFFSEKDGNEYTFFTAKVSGEPEGEQALETVRAITATAKYVLNSDNVYVSGNSQTVRDMETITLTDFAVVSLVSAAMILVILLFTFKDFITSLLLILVIELAIFINLSISRLMGTSLNFMSYIVISAIQLGATIDYAIILTKSYKTQPDLTDPFEALAQALKSCAFSITVSVSILCGACLSVYFISSDTIIREVTMLISRGAFISGILVLFALPPILTLTGKKR